MNSYVKSIMRRTIFNRMHRYMIRGVSFRSRRTTVWRLLCVSPFPLASPNHQEQENRTFVQACVAVATGRVEEWRIYFLFLFLFLEKTPLKIGKKIVQSCAPSKMHTYSSELQQIMSARFLHELRTISVRIVLFNKKTGKVRNWNESCRIVR